jgi:hypothetical protein
MLGKHALAAPSLANDVGERYSVQPASICRSAQHLQVADVFRPAEERLTTQPNRRVEAPGSEVVRIDHEIEHDTHREAAVRSF